MLVSASFLSSKNINDDLIKLNNTDIDFIHVDIMDGKFVANKSLPFSKLRNIYKYTSKRLDVHLMVCDPISYIKDYSYLNVEYIYIPVEIDNLDRSLNLIKSYGIKCGLAISPDTSIQKLLPYLDKIDAILVMSVYPGLGGQTFIDGSINRIESIKKIIMDNKKDIKLAVDGGINDETVKKVSLVDIVISGSYIINSNDFQVAINKLRK